VGWESHHGGDGHSGCRDLGVAGTVELDIRVAGLAGGLAHSRLHFSPCVLFVDVVRDPSGLLRRAAVGGTRGHSCLYGSAMCPSVSIAGRGVSAGLPLRCRALGSGALNRRSLSRTTEIDSPR